MKSENEQKVLDWIGKHPEHENMLKDMVEGIELSRTSISNILDILKAKGKIKVARKYGSAYAYALDGPASIAPEAKKPEESGGS